MEYSPPCWLERVCAGACGSCWPSEAVICVPFPGVLCSTPCCLSPKNEISGMLLGSATPGWSNLEQALEHVERRGRALRHRGRLAQPRMLEHVLPELADTRRRLPGIRIESG